jgi:hypothetical protein
VKTSSLADWLNRRLLSGAFPPAAEKTQAVSTPISNKPSVRSELNRLGSPPTTMAEEITLPTYIEWVDGSNLG